MNVKEEALKRKTAEAEALYEKGMLELEKISGLTSEQAKEYLLRSVEEDVKHDTAKLIKDLEAKAKEEAEKKAKDYVVTRFSAVLRIMWLRQPYQSYSFRMMR